MEKDEAIIRFSVSKEKRDQFKGRCILNGKTMNEVLAEFVEKYLKYEGKIEVVAKKSP